MADVLAARNAELVDDLDCWPAGPLGAAGVLSAERAMPALVASTADPSPPQEPRAYPAGCPPDGGEPQQAL